MLARGGRKPFWAQHLLDVSVAFNCLWKIEVQTQWMDSYCFFSLSILFFLVVVVVVVKVSLSLRNNAPSGYMLMYSTKTVLSHQKHQTHWSIPQTGHPELFFFFLPHRRHHCFQSDHPCLVGCVIRDNPEMDKSSLTKAFCSCPMFVLTLLFRISPNLTCWVDLPILWLPY